MRCRRDPPRNLGRDAASGRCSRLRTSPRGSRSTPLRASCTGPTPPPTPSASGISMAPARGPSSRARMVPRVRRDRSAGREAVLDRHVRGHGSHGQSRRHRGAHAVRRRGPAERPSDRSREREDLLGPVQRREGPLRQPRRRYRRRPDHHVRAVRDRDRDRPGGREDLLDQRVRRADPRRKSRRRRRERPVHRRDRRRRDRARYVVREDLLGRLRRHCEDREHRRLRSRPEPLHRRRRIRGSCRS